MLPAHYRWNPDDVTDEVAPPGLLRQLRDFWPSGPGGVILAFVLMPLWLVFALALGFYFNLFVGLAVLFSPLLLFRR